MVLPMSNRDTKSNFLITVVNATTEALYPEIYVTPNTGSGQDRIIQSTMHKR